MNVQLNFLFNFVTKLSTHFSTRFFSPIISINFTLNLFQKKCHIKLVTQIGHPICPHSYQLYCSMTFTDRCILAVVALSDCQEVMVYSKNIHIGSLDAEKIADSGLLYVFTMAFSTSPFLHLSVTHNLFTHFVHLFSPLFFHTL